MTDQEARDVDQFGYLADAESTAKRVARVVRELDQLHDQPKISGNEAEVLTSARQLIVTLAAGYRKHPEPELEYGRVTRTALNAAKIHGREVHADVLSDTPGNVEYQRNNGWVIVRRTKPGPWIPIDTSTPDQ